MVKVNVDLDEGLLSHLQASLAKITNGTGSSVMPRTMSAFSYAAKLIQKSWQNWAMGGSLVGAADIKNPNPRLSSSIKIRRISDFDLSIETDSRYMERIQNGMPEFDMKTKYPYGNKSRVVQSGKNKGVPYLIIPFRWGTPNKTGGARAHFGNTIPLEVYKILQSRNFGKSERKDSTHAEPNAKGENIERSEYSWGDRINDEDAGNANGMVKMKSNTGSTYFTFRVISANSPRDSWIRKEVPANNVIEAVKRTCKDNVEKLIEQGFLEDLGTP